MLEHANAVIAAVVGTVVIFGAIIGFVRWLRPKLQQMEAVGEAILGRPEARDRSGKVFQEPQPGAAARLKAIEESLSNLPQRVGQLENRVDAHEVLLAELNATHRERVAGKIEQTAAWQAIEAVAKTTPPAEDA